MDKDRAPTRAEIFEAALRAVEDAASGLPTRFRGPGVAAYAGVRAVLYRHLERAHDAAVEDVHRRLANEQTN